MKNHKKSLSGLVVMMGINLFVFEIASGCAAIYLPN